MRYDGEINVICAIFFFRLFCVCHSYYRCYYYDFFLFQFNLSTKYLFFFFLFCFNHLSICCCVDYENSSSKHVWKEAVVLSRDRCELKEATVPKDVPVPVLDLSKQSVAIIKKNK